MSDKPSMEMPVASIEDAIDDIRNGKIGRDTFDTAEES